MSDPTQVCVVVQLNDYDERWDPTKGFPPDDAPELICWGYEHGDAWGAGQDADWQDYDPQGPGENAPKFYGYVIAGTWHGVILMDSGRLLNAAAEAKVKLAKWYPKKPCITIIRGSQR